MTKREICERLLAIWEMEPYKRGEAVRDLLLDLAAPEETPKAEEKHPGVIAKPGRDGEIEWCWCQKCYAQAAVVHNPFGDGENWSYCQKCGVSFRLKREEGEKDLLDKEDAPRLVPTDGKHKTLYLCPHCKTFSAEEYEAPFDWKRDHFICKHCGKTFKCWKGDRPTGKSVNEEGEKEPLPHNCPVCGFCPVAMIGSDIWCGRCGKCYTKDGKEV